MQEWGRDSGMIFDIKNILLFQRGRCTTESPQIRADANVYDNLENIFDVINVALSEVYMDFLLISGIIIKIILDVINTACSEIYS